MLSNIFEQFNKTLTSKNIKLPNHTQEAAYTYAAADDDDMAHFPSKGKKLTLGIVLSTVCET